MESVAVDVMQEVWWSVWHKLKGRVSRGAWDAVYDRVRGGIVDSVERSGAGHALDDFLDERKWEW